MAFELPDISSLATKFSDSVSSNVNLDSIQKALKSGACGASDALDEVKGFADDIKAKLAEGKDALGELGDLAGDLQAKINDSLKELEAELDEATSSIQDEIAELQGKIGEDFAAAQAELKEKWGDVVDDIDELVDGIPSLTDLLSGDGEPIDLCADVPDLEKKTKEVVDEATGEVTTVIEDIKKAKAPKVADKVAEKMPEFKAELNAAFNKISTANKKTGKSFISVSIAYGSVQFKETSLANEYWLGATQEMDEMKAEWYESDEWKAIQKLSKEGAMTPNELRDADLLDDAQEAILKKRDQYLLNLKEFNKFKGEYWAAVTANKKIIVGSMTQEVFDQNLEGLKDYYSGVPDKAWDTLDNIIEYHTTDEAKQKIIDFNEYKKI